MARSHAKSGKQMAFAGWDARKPGDRLFFAVYPDAQAAQRILELAQAVRARHSLRGAARPTALTHVTLHYLGDHDGLPESLVAAAASAAQRVSMERFRLRFDRVASFAGRSRNRACVLRNDDPQANAPLRALHDALGRELRASGLGHVLEGRGFAPHVTLLYDAKTVEPEDVPPIEWIVDRFVLVHSRLGHGEHRPLSVRQLEGCCA